MLAIDGTKVHADASQHANLNYEQIAKKILEEAAEIDAAEDERFGDRRGDELPPELATAQGRRGWLRDAKRRLDERRAEEANPIPASRRTLNTRRFTSTSGHSAPNPCCPRRREEIEDVSG